MAKLSTPNRFKLIRKLKRISWIKKGLGHVARDPAIINDSPVIVRGYPVCNHDLYHLEVSSLERIKMGKYRVSGIHGINCPIFHDSLITEEYDSALDEARVAFHEWLTRTSWLNTVKAFLWINWMIFNGVNPFAVIYRHHKALQAESSNSADFQIGRDSLNR